MPHTRAVFPTLLAAVTWASAAGALDVWVDADGGSDEAAGSEGAPFGTLGRACAEPTDDASLVVHVRPGTYREVVRIERDGTHLLVAEADRGDVVLTGSEPSSSLVWTSADPAGLPAAASGQVWGADLSAWEVPPQIVTQAPPDGTLVRLPLAREPDWEVTTEWKWHEHWANAAVPWRYWEDEEPSSQMSAHYLSSPFLRQWGDLTSARAWMKDGVNRSRHLFARDHRPLARRGNHRGQPGVPHLGGDDDFGPASKFVLESAAALLDQEGEWFFDAATSKNHVWPMGGGDPAGLGLEIARRTRGIATAASDVLVDGLTRRGFNYEQDYWGSGARDAAISLRGGEDPVTTRPVERDCVIDHAARGIDLVADSSEGGHHRRRHGRGNHHPARRWPRQQRAVLARGGDRGERHHRGAVPARRRRLPQPRRDQRDDGGELQPGEGPALPRQRGPYHAPPRGGRQLRLRRHPHQGQPHPPLRPQLGRQRLHQVLEQRRHLRPRRAPLDPGDREHHPRKHGLGLLVRGERVVADDRTERLGLLLRLLLGDDLLPEPDLRRGRGGAVAQHAVQPQLEPRQHGARGAPRRLVQPREHDHEWPGRGAGHEQPVHGLHHLRAARGPLLGSDRVGPALLAHRRATRLAPQRLPRVLLGPLVRGREQVRHGGRRHRQHPVRSGLDRPRGRRRRHRGGRRGPGHDARAREPPHRRGRGAAARARRAPRAARPHPRPGGRSRLRHRGHRGPGAAWDPGHLRRTAARCSRPAARRPSPGSPVRSSAR